MRSNTLTRVSNNPGAVQTDFGCPADGATPEWPMIFVPHNGLCAFSAENRPFPPHPGPKAVRTPEWKVLASSGETGLLCALHRAKSVVACLF